MPQSRSYESLEKRIWDSLYTEPRQVAYGALSNSWQSTDEIINGFTTRTGYPINPDTIESYLQGFKEEGLVNQRARAPPESVSEWQLTSDGVVVQPISFWLIKYAVENETSIAKYIGKESPYEALKFLESVVAGATAEEVKQALKESERGVRKHFRSLQKEGVIDLKENKPQYGPEVEQFIDEAVAPVRRYLSERNSQQISYPMKLFSGDESLARHYQRSSVNLYLLKGSGLEGSVEFGKWLREERKSRNIGVRRLGKQAGCSHVYVIRVEQGKDKPSKKFINKVGEIFGIEEEVLSLFNVERKQKLILDVFYHNLEAVATLLSYEQIISRIQHNS